MADGDGPLRENLELQVSEIEMLQSMFPDEEEFELDDQGAFIDVQDFISGKTTTRPSRLNFNLKVEAGSTPGSTGELGSVIIELICDLPHSYPKTSAELFARSEKLSRDSQKELNNELKAYLLTLEVGELCILPAIQWLQENSATFIERNSNMKLSENQPIDQVEKRSFVRMWMYMHHIYSKTKRKIILEWSTDYNLTGFSLPGKPGVVCIEGEECNVEEYYGRLRRLNWKKITCRHRETGDITMDINKQRKFRGFEELAFDVHGTRESHMDMGQFFQYLEKHNLGEIFQILFGVEGK